MKIKPCPKCGKRADIDGIYYSENPEYEKVRWIRCMECNYTSSEWFGFSSYGFSFIIDTWNMLSDYSNKNNLLYNITRRLQKLEGDLDIDPRLYASESLEDNYKKAKSFIKPVNEYVKEKSPYKCFNGNELYEGDLIKHPDGTTGKIIFLKQYDHPGDQWRVLYEDNVLSRLLLQIGKKGMATKVIDIEKPLKPVNEACVGKDVLVSDDKFMDGIGREIRQRLLCIDNNDRPYIVTSESINSNCGVYRRFLIAKRCPDIVYGDEGD